uniref:Integrase catalytic domain-containing protein n=1 Tax=Glossina palpalis gambiensis TaxID=67801 RepID=A0A1B0B5Q1_9MUSC
MSNVVFIFFANYITLFGVPLQIASDHDNQFNSMLFNELVKYLGSHKITTSSHLPQSDGFKFVFVRKINKHALEQSFEGPYIVVEKETKYSKNKQDFEAKKLTALGDEVNNYGSMTLNFITSFT